MFSAPPIVMVVFVLLYGAAGALLGAMGGWITAVALKVRCRFIVNGALGAVGFLLGGLIAIAMPWHANTITYELSGGTKVSSTMNSYQYPERVAVIVAIALGALHEVWRKRRLSA